MKYTEKLYSFFKELELAVSDLGGVECWSARELQVLLGYNKWENFKKKAKDAWKNAGEIIGNHFPDVRKMVEIGSSAVFTYLPYLANIFDIMRYSGMEILVVKIGLSEAGEHLNQKENHRT